MSHSLLIACLPRDRQLLGPRPGLANEDMHTVAEHLKIIPFFLRTIPKPRKPQQRNYDSSTIYKVDAQRFIAEAHRLSPRFLNVNAQRTHTISPRYAHGVLEHISVRRALSCPGNDLRGQPRLGSRFLRAEGTRRGFPADGFGCIGGRSSAETSCSLSTIHCRSKSVSSTPLELAILFRRRASLAFSDTVSTVPSARTKTGCLTSSRSPSKSVRSCVSQNLASPSTESICGRRPLSNVFSIVCIALSLFESFRVL